MLPAPGCTTSLRRSTRRIHALSPPKSRARHPARHGADPPRSPPPQCSIPGPGHAPPPTTKPPHPARRPTTPRRRIAPQAPTRRSPPPADRSIPRTTAHPQAASADSTAPPRCPDPPPPKDPKSPSPLPERPLSGSPDSPYPARIPPPLQTQTTRLYPGLPHPPLPLSLVPLLASVSLSSLASSEIVLWTQPARQKWPSSPQDQGSTQRCPPGFQGKLHPIPASANPLVYPQSPSFFSGK